MAKSSEDKSALTQRLEKDRLGMAVEVDELKKSYNLSSRLRDLVRKEPWYWIAGSLLIGFLLSRLPARHEKIYFQADSSGTKEVRNLSPKEAKKGRSQIGRSVWSLVKPIITAYVGREVYKRARTAHNSG
jgi:hypothetical protein